MIKFFRRIRKTLIDQNQMGKPSSAKASAGKYFKYAIGEILLVVIGILIALQVNNWNQQRISQKEQNSLMESIKKDLESDVDYLNSYLQTTNETYQLLRDQSEKINRIAYNKDSLANFLKNEIYVFLTNFEGFNNNTYESIKTSGKLDLLETSIRQPMYELSLLQNVHFKEYENLRIDYFDEIENLVRHYPIQVSFSFIKNTPQTEFIWDDVDRKEMLLHLNAWGTMKANLFRNNTRQCTQILEKTEAVLELIKKNSD